MILRTVRDSESLDSVAEELLFTESRLKSDEHAKDMAAPMTALMAQVDQVRLGQIAASRSEVTAQAAVAAAADLLDDWIRSLDRALREVVRGNIESPRYKRYFATAPSSFVRLGLESEISRVRGWVESLAGEPEQILKDLGASLATLLTQGDAALDQRRKAVSGRSDHRVRSITSLIDEINTTRTALYGNLARKAADTGLPIDWPARFFRHGGRSKDEKPEEAKPAPPSAGA